MASFLQSVSLLALVLAFVAVSNKKSKIRRLMPELIAFCSHICAKSLQLEQHFRINRCPLAMISVQIVPRHG